MRLEFDDFEFDSDAYELRRNGQPVAMEPQVFDVLAYLIAHRDRLVSKEELLDEVWGDRFVSESALTSRIKVARQVLGDDGRRQRYIRTIHGRGYRFAPDDETDAVFTEADHDPLASVGHNIPPDRTPLFGRDAEMDAVAGLLEDHRLVSLLGMGGTGKTRLAASAARQIAEDFDGGVWFVDLIPAADAREVETALVHAAQLSVSTGSARDQLAALTSDRQVLFVIDNCEHVLDDVAEIVDQLLATTHTPRFLVTSREPLELRDECRMQVQPLAVHADRGPGPAVALFAASAERFGVALSAEDDAVVAEVCDRLDGLPLAIELAAAQLRHLTLDDLAARLDRRFDLLAGIQRTGTQRHASLMAVLDGTWDLLSPPERSLLCLLSVFPGRFSLDDVEQVLEVSGSAAGALALAGLMDRSLVVRDDDGRYRLLETVRLFVRQRSESEDYAASANWHASWCLQIVGYEPGPHFYDFELAEWCLQHYDDLRAAERHLIAAGSQENAAMILAAQGLAMHVDLGGRAAETLRRIEERLTHTESPVLRARLHCTAVMCGMATRSPDVMAQHGSAAVSEGRAGGNHTVLALALVLASWSEVFLDGDEALRTLDEAIELARGVDDEATAALAHGYKVFHLAVLRRDAEAAEAAGGTLGATDRSVTDYPAAVALAAATSIGLVAEPTQALARVEELLGWPSSQNRLWANEVLGASVYAANGMATETARVTLAIRERLERAGQDLWPDLLIPPAMLAYATGDAVRAQQWLRTIKDAGRPTQSFQVTCVFGRLRSAVGLAESSPLDSVALDVIGNDALNWLADRAALA